MKLTTLICEVCSTEVLPKQLNQRTCGKEACKKVIHGKWKKKNLNYSRECLKCGTTFNTTHSSKKYCSKKCSDDIRILRQRMNSTHWARVKNGTYDKYARILREVGYTVVAPRGGVR